MSEAAQSGAEALQARMESLRSAGAWRLDPARFLALEALARRIPGQSARVQGLLQQKLQAGVVEFTQRLAVMAAQETAAPAGRDAAGHGALAQLNAYLRDASRAARMDTDHEASSDDAQLASARRFRQAWDRIATLDRVEQAVARKPANAGPLNSHMLVLRTLDMMRELSPEYLRRFVGYAESLQWLEQARPPASRAASKAGAAAPLPARGRRKKK